MPRDHPPQHDHNDRENRKETTTQSFSSKECYLEDLGICLGVMDDFSDFLKRLENIYLKSKLVRKGDDSLD